MRRIKHAMTALATPSIPYTAWNDWLVDEAGAVIDLLEFVPVAPAVDIAINATLADINFKIGAVGQANAFYLDGADGRIGLGTTGFNNWGLMQLWYTGTPTPAWDCGGIRTGTIFNPSVDGGNIGWGVMSEVLLNGGTPVGGYPTSTLGAVLGTASNNYAKSELQKLYGGSFEARVYGNAVSEVYGVMVQAMHGSYSNAVVGSLHGIYADAYTSDMQAGKTLAIGTAYGAELRSFCKTNYATSVSHISTLYGLFSSLYCQQAVGSAATIDDAYNIYLTGERPGGIGAATYGPITNYYHLYLDSLAAINSANKWAIYVVDGDNYLGGSLRVMGQAGFFGHAIAAQPTKAGHNNWAAISDVTAALAALGLVDAA